MGKKIAPLVIVKALSLTISINPNQIVRSNAKMYSDQRRVPRSRPGRRVACFERCGDGAIYCDNMCPTVHCELLSLFFAISCAFGSTDLEFLLIAAAE